MRYPMHQSLPAREQKAWNGPVRLAAAAVVFALLAAVVVYILVQGLLLLGVITAVLLVGTALLLGASWWDVHHAYVEVAEDEIIVAEYPLFYRQERRIARKDVVAMEVSVNTVGFTPSPYLTIVGAAMNPLFSIRRSAETEAVFTAIVKENQGE